MMGKFLVRYWMSFVNCYFSNVNIYFFDKLFFICIFLGYIFFVYFIVIFLDGSGVIIIGEDGIMCVWFGKFVCWYKEIYLYDI